MLRQLRSRWYYPKCLRLRLPQSHTLYIWAFSPLWPSSWLGRRVWQYRPNGTFNITVTLGPLELTVNAPAWSRLMKEAR